MPPKTADCGAGEARNYLAKARGFLDAADLRLDDPEPAEREGALAVLGIDDPL